MNFKLKHIFTVLIFSGFFLSSFQITVNHFIKNIKVDGIELSAEDIDDNEEDSETEKIELEDDYFISEFSFSFAKNNHNKLKLFCEKQKNSTPPIITINTPPPKV